MFLLSFRPAVRALPSKQMFDHMLKRHDVLFVYVGGESPLKVSTIFFLCTIFRYCFINSCIGIVMMLKYKLMIKLLLSKKSLLYVKVFVL